jgi:hypothetical protein
MVIAGENGKRGVSMRRLIALLFVVGLLVALPSGAGAGSNPPNCERGQTNAFYNTTANNSDHPSQHEAQFFTCLIGHQVLCSRGRSSSAAPARSNVFANPPCRSELAFSGR